MSSRLQKQREAYKAAPLGVGVHQDILGNHRKVAATTNCNLGRVGVGVSQDDKGIHAMIIGSRSIAADNRIAMPDCVGDIR